MLQRIAGPGPFFRAVLVLAFGCGGSSAICDVGALEDALASAAAGDVVAVGQCEITDVSVTVPAGVTLRGEDGSVLAGSGTVVQLGDGAAIELLRVRSADGVGIQTGPGGELTDVVVELQRGVGITLRGSDIAITRVRIEGPDDAEDLPPFAEPSEGAYGLVSVDASNVAIADLEIAQAGPWGAILANTTLTWVGGLLEDVVGTGVYVDGGSADLQDVTFRRFGSGLQPLPAYGAVFTENALATTSGLDISEVDLGILHDASSGTHTDLAAHDIRYGGVWIQRSDDVSLMGGVLERNGVTSVASVRSSNVTLDGTLIESSVSQLAIFGEITAVETGDGVQLVEPTGPNTLRAVMLQNHPRIGLLLDLQDMAALDQVSLTDVTVQGDELGCLAQTIDGLIPLGGWDDQVNRIGGVGDNDAARGELLDLGGGLSDGNLPDVDTTEL